MKSENNINLLILSYHYLPMNVIASYRPKGFADHLYKYGIYPTIITHRWELDANSRWKWHGKDEGVVEEANDNYRIFRVPRRKTKTGNLLRLLEKLWILNKLRIVFSWLLGHLDTTIEDLDSYLNYKRFVFQHLSQHRYDIVMGIYSPHHHLRLCYEIRRNFGLPYILDFRDLWDNRSVDPGFIPKGELKWKYFLVKKYWSKWLSQSLFFTTISDDWVDKISEISFSKGYKIMHGYDDDIAAIQGIQPSAENFIVLYSGTLYDDQDLTGFLKGVNDFVTNRNPEKFLLVFLGSDRTRKDKNEMWSGMISNISKSFSKYVLFTERVERKEVLKWYGDTSVFVSLTYNKMPGTFSGKFFEYIGTGKTIIVYNDPSSLIAKTVSNDNLGFVCKNGSEISERLSLLYQEWSNSALIRRTNKSYSRDTQTKYLSDFIWEELNKKIAQKA